MHAAEAPFLPVLLLSSSPRCHGFGLNHAAHTQHNTPQDIQERIEDQQQETHKVLEHNKALGTENELLKAQLGSTQELLNELRTTQQDKIAALADKLQEQVCTGAGSRARRAVSSCRVCWYGPAPWWQASVPKTSLLAPPACPPL
jgi:septal ring factor EnvC (AmiA/AmiB activator)